MARASLSRFRPASDGLAGRRAWIQRRLGLLLLVLLILASGALFITVPLAWMNQRLRSIAEPFAYRSYEQLQWIESAWKSPPLPPGFDQGTEGVVGDWLEREALLVLLAPAKGSEAWVREGPRLVRHPVCPEPYRIWLKQARSHPGLIWNPERAKDRAAIVIRTREGYAIREWRIGSPNVEAFLRQTLGPSPLIRAGLRRRSLPERASHRSGASWSLPPNLQTDFSQEKPGMMDPASGQGAFGEGWEIAAIPGPGFEKTLQAVFRRSRNEALLVLVFILGLWGLAWHVNRRNRLLERAHSEHLASFTHSLKTPLAVLKLRCDSLRLGSLPPETTTAQLLKVGEEVDQLARILDHALAGFRGTPGDRPKARVETAWIQALVEDLRPAFEAQDRELAVSLEAVLGWAHLPSLRNGLVTLLENALLHGSGPVGFQGTSLVNRLRFTVTNQAPDLEPGRIVHLGRPFQRLRKAGSEGFRRDGHGLGLFLLAQVCREERWGLNLVAKSGGFMAQLDVHLLPGEAPQGGPTGTPRPRWWRWPFRPTAS